MNKQDLIEAVLANKEAGIESKAAAARAIDAVLDGIAAGIKKDGNVQLSYIDLGNRAFFWLGDEKPGDRADAMSFRGTNPYRPCDGNVL